MLEIENVIAAFSEDQVQRLTKLTKNRLRYWHQTGFFVPAYTSDNARLPHSRIYSFKDVVALRTLELLRVQHRVPLQHLRQVAAKLAHLKSDLWTSTTLYVANRRVVLINQESEQAEGVFSGQAVLPLALTKIIAGTMQEIEHMRRRAPTDIGRVAKSDSICHKAWVIAGTRIPVAAIRRLHEDGYSTSDIISEFPDLRPEDVEAALVHKEKKAA